MLRFFCVWNEHNAQASNIIELTILSRLHTRRASCCWVATGLALLRIRCALRLAIWRTIGHWRSAGTLDA